MEAREQGRKLSVYFRRAGETSRILLQQLWFPRGAWEPGNQERYRVALAEHAVCFFTTACLDALSAQAIVPVPRCFVDSLASGRRG